MMPSVLTTIPLGDSTLTNQLPLELNWDLLKTADFPKRMKRRLKKARGLSPSLSSNPIDFSEDFFQALGFSDKKNGGDFLTSLKIDIQRVQNEPLSLKEIFQKII